MLRFDGAGATDVGHVREHNEDAAFVGPYVALVADGVGGAAAGEVASATAAYVVSSTTLARPADPPAEVLRDAATAAQQCLHDGMLADDSRHGMATTLTAVVCDGREVWLGHVGDSRGYLLRDGELRQVSADHTYVQHMLDNGQLTREEAAVHHWRHVVVRSLDGVTGVGADDLGSALFGAEDDGVDPDEPVLDVVRLDAGAGDRLLLCSDGLTDLVSDADIAEMLATDDAQAAAGQLVDAALAAGGRDNVTCVVLDVVDGPRVVGDGRVLGALSDPANLVDPTRVAR